MKLSRIGHIVQVADNRSAELIDTLPPGRARTNAELVHTICKTLVKRREPLLPSAALVSEEGRKANPHFPAEQTIYNSYASILRVWRKGYHDVMNINSDGPLATNQVGLIDTSGMDVSSANIIDRLKEIVLELTQRNNALKQIIDKNVPVTEDNKLITTGDEEAVVAFGKWLRSLADNPAFQLDEIGLKVSRKTPIGTRIIDATLLYSLLSFTDDFEKSRTARLSFDK